MFSVSSPHCRLCGRAHAHVRRPRDVAAVRELPGRGPARPGRGLLPAPRAGLRAVPARPAPGLHRGRGHLQRLRLLLLVLRLVGAAREGVRRRAPPSGSASGPDSFVVEVASNDGYLLQHSRRAGDPRRSASSPRPTWRRRRWSAACPPRCSSSARRPAPKVAADARPGRPRRRQQRLRPRARHRRLQQGPAGARGRRRHVTIEIPHLLRLIEGNEYDTIYHEHFSYLSLLTTQRVLAEAGLTVVDVEELPSHGGSLRTWSMPTEQRRRAERGGRRRCWPPRRPPACTRSRATPASPRRWSKVRDDLVEFLVGCAARRASGSWPTARRARATPCSTTAASAATSIEFGVDRNPYKHGKFLPGTHIPIHPVEALAEARPDYVADHAVEPAQGDRPPARVRPRVGWRSSSSRCPSSRSSRPGQEETP